MKHFFSGTPSNSREASLINHKVGHRLVSFLFKEKTMGIMRKWGMTPVDPARGKPKE